MTIRMHEDRGGEGAEVSQFLLYWASNVLTYGDALLVLGIGHGSICQRLETLLRVRVHGAEKLAETRLPLGTRTPRDDELDFEPYLATSFDVDTIWLLNGTLPALKDILACIAKSRPAIGCSWSETTAGIELVNYACALEYDAQLACFRLDKASRQYLILVPREKRKRFELRENKQVYIERITNHKSGQGKSSSQSESQTNADAGTKGPLIAVSFYRTPQLVEFIRDGLVRISSELAAHNCKVVLYNDSPDEILLSETLEAASAQLSEHVSCSVVTNASNVGFIVTMNSAMAQARQEGRDVILLNSDAMLSPGALGEMLEVASMDPMIGFVCPRSNNATLATAGSVQEVEIASRGQQRKLERSICASLRFLPRFQFVPTAVGYCLLIKHLILVNFGEFSVDYGLGYNEENDLIMRAGRFGYRAALANWGYALHLGEQSFAFHSQSRSFLEGRNRRLLDSRYPEYGHLINSYFKSARYNLEGFLVTLQELRLSIAIDCTALTPGHNGTISLIVSLVREISNSFGARMDITLIGDRKSFKYHGLDGLARVRFSDGWPAARYDVALKIGQPFGEDCLIQMSKLSPVNVFFMLDTIAVDCCQLYKTELEMIWSYVASSADGLIFNSKFTRGQFNRRFSIDSDRTIQKVSYHSIDPADYKPSSNLPGSRSSHVLIVGNHYPHKNVWPTYRELVSGAPEHIYIVLGGGNGEIVTGRNDIYYESGNLSSELVGSLYSNAAFVVFPSFYEGFGFPIQNALAYQRPIYIRDNDLNRELLGLIRSPNVRLYRSTPELLEMIVETPAWIPYEIAESHTWQDSAKEIIEFCLQCLNRTQLQTVVKRERNLRNLLLDLETKRPRKGAGRFFRDIWAQARGFALPTRVNKEIDAK